MSAQLGEAVLAAAGRAPCGTCQHTARCAAQRLACDDFRYYVIHGEIPVLAPEDAAELPPRQPTAELFNIIYNGDDDNEVSI